MMKLLIKVLLLFLISFNLFANEDVTITGFEFIPIEQGGAYEPAVLLLDFDIPNNEIFSIAYWLEGTPEDVEIEASFNGSNVTFINSLPLIVGEIGYLTLDISDLRLLSGQLKFTFSTTSSANLTLVTEIEQGNTNQAPTILNPISYSVVEQSDITILSEATDKDGDFLTYSWQQISGYEVLLDDTELIELTFVAPEVDSQSILEFELSVFDGLAFSKQIYTVMVNQVDSPNTPPQLVVSQSVDSLEEGKNITLSFTTSDDDGDSLTISYNQTQGSKNLLEGDILLNGDITIIAPNVNSDEAYSLEFSVNDGKTSVVEIINFTVTDKLEDKGVDELNNTNSNDSGGSMSLWLFCIIAVSFIWKPRAVRRC